MANTSLVSIRNTTGIRTPRIPVERIVADVLGPDYELSLAFVGDARSRRLNREFRGKDKPTNVLAFALDESAGEIVINLPFSKKQAPQFAMRFSTFVAYLFIHGLLHLKGHTHGSKMEDTERQLLRSYKL